MNFDDKLENKKNVMFDNKGQPLNEYIDGNQRDKLLNDVAWGKMKSKVL